MSAKRYLIVEDEPLIAMDLEFAFADANALSVSASSVDAALAAIDRFRFDGAVLDVNLGRGETCERAARRLTELGIPFVLHTGDLNRVGELLRSLGAPILPKPLAAEEVVRHVMGLTRPEPRAA